MSLILIITQASAAISLGNCPGAYIDYEYWTNYRNNITRTVPVDVTMDAVRALRQCRRDGVEVPYTVRDYNIKLRRERRDAEVRAEDVDRLVNPSGRPFYEQ